MDYVKEANRNKAKTIIKNLSKRNMEGYFCETKEEAVEKAMSLMENNSSVSWGGTMTVDEIGLKKVLHEKNLKVIDRDNAKTPEERENMMKEAFFCDNFLTSTNAITLDGELINVDGNANRVAAICFGPKNVIVIAGMNKVVPDIESGIDRVHAIAAPVNCVRLNINNPCAVTGKCASCINHTICCQTVITRASRVHNRIKVILVNENLGF